jgi:DHA1 family bicyclomycin/chloramphenicol resistance-like MFS transporter
MKVHSLHPITVFLLIATMPLAAASLDMFLPALPAMVKEFGTTATTIQISLSLNIGASAILGFTSGILSDQFGRRRLFISALFGFTIAIYMCSLATNVIFFTIARTIQGAASGVIFVMVTTILSDVYHGVKKAQVLGIATFLFPIALGIAPFFGEEVYRHYGWPAIFISLSIVLLLVSLILFLTLPETKIKEETKLSFKRIGLEATKILCMPTFLVNALIPAVFMGAFMAFIAYSPFIYMTYFGLTSKVYVYYFITPLIFQFCGGVLYQWVVRVLGTNKTLTGGVILSVCALVVILGVLIDLLPCQPEYLMTAMLFYNSSIPFILPSVMAKAFETFPSKGGTISSLASLLRNTCMAMYIYITGLIFDGTPIPIFWVLMVGIVLFVILSIYSIRLSHKMILHEKSTMTFNG